MEKILNKPNWLENFVSQYKGTIIEVLARSGNKPREVARRAPGVRAIAITAEAKFIISREYREYLDTNFDYRLPGGKVADSLAAFHQLLTSGNLRTAIAAAAARELEEETGYHADTIKLIAVSNSGGTIDWDLHYFEMKDLTLVGAKPEDDEQIDVLELTLQQTINLVLDKKISEDRSRMILLDYLIEHYPPQVAESIAKRAM